MNKTHILALAIGAALVAACAGMTASEDRYAQQTVAMMKTTPSTTDHINACMRCSA